MITYEKSAINIPAIQYYIVCRLGCIAGASLFQCESQPVRRHLPQKYIGREFY